MIWRKLRSLLQKNLFPPDLIDKVVRNYLSNQCKSKESLNKKEGRYFKLPYVGLFLETQQNKMNHLKIV